MVPETVGLHIASAAVASALFLGFLIISIANIIFTKFKLYEVIAVSSASKFPVDSVLPDVVDLVRRGRSVVKSTKLDFMKYILWRRKCA